MHFHIGKQIKIVLYQKNIKIKDFAKKINKTRSVVYNIFGRESIDTALLNQISIILQHNFFQYYTLPEDMVLKESRGVYNRVKKIPEACVLKKENEKLVSEIEMLKKEITYLQKINQLLENQKGRV